MRGKAAHLLYGSTLMDKNSIERKSYISPMNTRQTNLTYSQSKYNIVFKTHSDQVGAISRIQRRP